MPNSTNDSTQSKQNQRRTPAEVALLLKTVLGALVKESKNSGAKEQSQPQSQQDSLALENQKLKEEGRMKPLSTPKSSTLGRVR